MRYLLSAWVVLAATEIHASESTNILANNFQQDIAFNKVSLVSNNSESYSGFFELQDSKITISVVGSKEEALDLEAKLSFFKVQVFERDKEKIVNYLKNITVAPNYADDISEYLIKGINGTRECRGNKTECILDTSELEFVVDYYNKSVRIFVPSEMFTSKVENITLKASAENMMINHFYGTSSYRNDLDYFYRVESLLGFKNGYFKSNVSGNENLATLDQINYNYDGEIGSGAIGLISTKERLGLAGNQTIINDRFVGVEFSNKNSLKITNHASSAVEFFSPTDGILKVYNSNGEIITQKNIQSGRNSIFYRSLPYGDYLIKYEVVNNDNVVFKGESYVYNSDFLDTRDYSAYIRLGELDRENDYQNNNFFDIGVSIPTLKSQSATLSLSNVDDEVFGGYGYYVNFNNYNASVKHFLGEKGSRMQFSVYGSVFSMSAEKNDIYDDRSYLGTEDSLSFSIGANKSFGATSLGINANYNELADDNYLSYGLNGSYFLRNGSSIYTSFNFTEDDSTLNIGLTIPFGNKYTYNSNFVNSKYASSFRNSVHMNTSLNDELSVGSSLGYEYKENQDNDVDLYLSGTYRNEHFNTASSVRKQTGDKAVFGSNISSSMYVTKNNIYFKDYDITKNSGLEINKLSENLQGDIIVKNKISNHKNKLEVEKSDIITSNTYLRNVLDYDFDSDNFALASINVEPNETLDMLPGKIHYIDINQTPVSSILVIRNPDDEIPNCLTENSCFDSQEINESIYKFRVIPNSEVKIVSGKKQCFDGIVNEKSLNIGRCN